MELTYTLLVLIAAFFGLLILAGGAVLLLATPQKKAGIALLVAGLVFILCPLLGYALVLLNSMRTF